MKHIGKTTNIQEFAKTLSAWDMKRCEVDGHKYRCFAMKVSLPSLKRGTEKMRGLVCREYDENNRLKEPISAVTNRKDFRVDNRDLLS
jgi:hypothetical protein